MHLHPEDQAQRKVEETIDKESRMAIHLLYNTKQHCVCIGNLQEWKGDVRSGQESQNKSREKGEATIQHERGKEESEWCIGVEQGKAGVYYTVDKNWREVCNFKSPRTRARRMLWIYWKKDKEEDNKMSSEKNRPQKKHWWEEEDEGYNTDRNLKAEYDWENKTIGKIKERLGVEEQAWVGHFVTPITLP